MRRDEMSRRVTWITGSLSVVFALVVFAPHAGAAVDFAVVNGTVNGTALHVIGATNAFPNFATGAIDNRYPLAHAHLDGSPFSQGTASPADTGPLGATIAADAHKTQPQYADARFPPKASTQEFGKAPGPHAIASADEGVATAAASFAGTPPELESGSPQAEEASYRALNDALIAWRAEFFSPATSARYPFVAAEASEPDSFDGLTASSRATLDPARGLVVTTDARLARALLAGGSFSLTGLRAKLEIVNKGTPSETVTLDVGDASIGGIPVRIGHDGVVVNTTKLPDLAGRAEQASAALNQALATAGFQISQLAPEITPSESQKTVLAAAVVIRWQQPPTAPGIPQQTVELRLGEAFGDSLAIPEQTIGLPGLSGPVITSGLPSITGTVGAAGEVQPAAGVATGAVRAAKPTWLLLSYIVWQVLMIGTVVSLWRWHAEGSLA